MGWAVKGLMARPLQGRQDYIKCSKVSFSSAESQRATGLVRDRSFFGAVSAYNTDMSSVETS